MVEGKDVPPGDLVVARMIINDMSRHRRLQVTIAALSAVALVSAVVYGLVTGDWHWVPMITLTFVTISGALQVRAQRVASRWKRRYLADNDRAYPR